MGFGHRPTSTGSPIQSRSKRCGNNPPKGPLASGQAHLLEADSENCLPCVHEDWHDPPDLRDIRKYRNPATGRLLWCTQNERVWKQKAFTIHSPNSTDNVICVSAWAKERQAAGAKADVKDGQAAVKSVKLRHGPGRAGRRSRRLHLPRQNPPCDHAVLQQKSQEITAILSSHKGMEMLVCPTLPRSSTQKDRVCKRALSRPCPSPPFCNPASSRFPMSHQAPSISRAMRSLARRSCFREARRVYGSTRTQVGGQKQ